MNVWRYKPCPDPCTYVYKHVHAYLTCPYMDMHATQWHTPVSGSV